MAVSTIIPVLTSTRVNQGDVATHDQYNDLQRDLTLIRDIYNTFVNSELQTAAYADGSVTETKLSETVRANIFMNSLRFG